jgi:uncharacterized repeat protein (TIGR01451 family)
VVLCDFGDVPGDINSNVVVSVSIVAQLMQGGSATNNLALLSFGPDQNPVDNTTRVVTTVSAASDLAVTMAAAPSGVVVLNNNVTYTLTVTNQGPLPAGAVVLTNVLPAGLAFVSASATVGSCTHSSGRVTCNLGTMAVNAGARVTLVARAAASGFQTNRANVVSASIDPVPGNSSASVVVKASAAPTIQSIGNRSIAEDTTLGPLALAISDSETPAESLVLTGASSNPSLVPASSIVYGGSGTARSFSVNPATNAWGTVWITNTVTDGDGLSTSTSFMLTVTSVPDPPVITDILNQSGNEDTVIGPILFVIGDAESSATTLNLSGASTAPGLIPNANIQFGGSGSNRTVTLRPLTNQFGTATISITVGDGTSMTTDQFVVTVNSINDLPTINDVSNRAINEDSPSGTTIGLSIGDVETPAASLVLSATSSNQVLVPNGNITFSAGGTSRSVTIIPAANQFGTTLITLTVTDTDGGSTSDTFVLTVNPVNDPPTLATIPHMTISEDSGTANVTLTGISTGASNELQTNVISASSSQLSLIPHPTVTYTSPNATATLSLAPVADSNGVATITVTVNDGGLSNSVVTRTFNVTVNAINDAPFISALTNAVIDEDSSTGAIPFTVGDVDSPISSLTASARSSNTTLVPDANVVLNGAGASRTVTVTPAGNQSGETTITVFVTDGAATNTGTFLLAVRSVNDQPSISIATNELVVAEDQTASFGLAIGDAETPPVGLTLTALSSNPSLTPTITFDGSGSNRTVSVVPAANLSGTATITFSVFDPDGGSNTVSLLLTILEVNDPPTLDAPTDLVIVEDAPLQVVTLTGISSGAPNEVQTLAVTASSDNPALIPHPAVMYTSPEAAGRLEFNPVPNGSGEAGITVSVSDGQATNSRIFRVLVTGVNDPPSIASISDRETNEDVTATVPLAIGDVETPADQLTVRAISSNPELLDETGISFTGAGANRNLLLTPLADQSGQSTTITVIVGDGTNEVSVEFSLTVVPVNDLPTISGLADLAIAQDSGPTNVMFTVNDPETLPSSLLANAFSANQTLLPDANVVVTGSGASRTLTLTPAAGQSGAAAVRVVVRDGAGASVTNSFTLTVGLMQVTLLIERSGNSAVISWPGDSPGWTLQNTTNLNLAGSWTPVAEVPVLTNNRYRVTNSLSGASRFYRLRKP